MLDRSFESIVYNPILKMHIETVSISRVTSLLFSHESWLELHNVSNTSLLPIANFSQGKTYNASSSQNL